MRDHERRSLGVLHDAPHLVDHQQAGPWVTRRGRPHRLGAHHRRGRTKLGLEQPQVEHRHRRLSAQQVVALVGQQVSQASRGEWPQQHGEVAVPLLPEECVEVTEARSLAGPGVIGRQEVVEQGPALGAQALAHHHLDQPAQAAYALQQFLGIAPVDHERVHALAGNTRRQHAPARGPCHVRVLPLRVDHVRGHPAAQAPQHAELGRKGLAAARPGQHRRVRVEVRAVERVVDHRRACPKVDAVQRAASRIHVRR